MFFQYCIYGVACSEGRLEMAVLMVAADDFARYSISAASDYKFRWEMSKSQGSRSLVCSSSHPELNMFVSSGFACWQLCFLVFHSDFALFQVPGDNEKHWKPVLVVLTEKDLLIYESMPRIKEAWFSPVHTYPLLATRYLCFSIMTAFRSSGNSWVSQEQV